MGHDHGPGSPAGAPQGVGQSHRPPLVSWLAVALGLALAAGLLVAFRGRFAPGQELAAYPGRTLACGMVLAGLLYLQLVPLIQADAGLRGRALRQRLRFIVAVGLGLRLAMLWSVPALEDDYNRYLWDGGVTAHGHNPYRYPPAEAGETGTGPDALKALATDAEPVHGRINHPNLRTIYPPVAQATFALAHLAEPWSLLAWRLVCLTGEIATLGLLQLLLSDLRRSPLWVALYWWNPLAIKELMNSAHMEAILLPLVLAALLLSIRQRPFAATGMLALAAGTKLWPVLLAPLLWRQLLNAPRHLVCAAAILAGACAVWLVPPWIAGFGDDSGFAAYATYWKTNSALMPTLERVLVLARLGAEGSITVGRAARVLVGLTLVGVVLRLAWRPVVGPQDLVDRATLSVAALYLLSPSQFPWYLMWLQPLLCLTPMRGWLLATVLLPVYYVSFSFYAADRAWLFRDGIVWIIWLPIWGVLLYDAWHRRRLGGGGANALNDP
jgi:alpha-1,6-mannosyltransferase